MLECNRNGFAISTGSACHTGKQAPSNTMTAMGIPEKTAKEFIRISFGKDTKEEDIRKFGQLIHEIIAKEAVRGDKS